MKFKIKLNEATPTKQDVSESSAGVVDIRSAIKRAGLDPDVFEDAYRKAGAKKLAVFKSTAKLMGLAVPKVDVMYSSYDKYRVGVVLGINCDDSFYQSFEKEFNSNTQARFKFINAGFGQMEKTTTGFRMFFG